MARSEPAKKVRPRVGEADERLLIEAAQRDRARFAEVYEVYFNLVYGYVARRMRDRSRTEDITSEVFQKALANLPRFKWTGAPFGAWLIRIASNLIADRAKQAARETADPESSITNGTTSGKMQFEVEEAERRAYVIRMVDELPEDQRRVVRMRFAEEKSISQIAGELDRSEGAVKQLQFRALQTLRAKLIE